MATENAWVLIEGVVLAGFLLSLSAIDIRRLLVPDALTLPLIALGVGAHAAAGDPIATYVAGAAIGYLSFVLVEKIYARLRGRAGLGRGDAKLFAAGGAWCGAVALPAIVLIASACGLIYLVLATLVVGAPAREAGRIPFGPFLSVGIVAVWITREIASPGFLA